MVGVASSRCKLSLLSLFFPLPFFSFFSLAAESTPICQIVSACERVEPVTHVLSTQLTGPKYHPPQKAITRADT